MMGITFYFKTMEFAKLFDLEDGSQVLVTRLRYDDEEKICVRTDFQGAEASVTYRFNTAEAADRIFGSWTEGMAVKVREEIQGAVGDPP